MVVFVDDNEMSKTKRAENAEYTHHGGVLLDDEEIARHVGAKVHEHVHFLRSDVNITDITKSRVILGEVLERDLLVEAFGNLRFGGECLLFEQSDELRA